MNSPEDVAATPGLQRWEDIALVYARQVMDNGRALAEYNVPPGCQILVAMEDIKLRMRAPYDKDAAYWN